LYKEYTDSKRRLPVLATKTRVGFLTVALVVNLALASTLNAGDAHACSCAGGFSAQEELRDSDAVFWGEAVSVEEQEVMSSTPRSWVRSPSR